MNIARSIGRHRIGGWEFLPATGELRRRTDLRRLEPQRRRTLELLCEAKGEVVSQEAVDRRGVAGPGAERKQRRGGRSDNCAARSKTTPANRG